ncbi:MAG: DUF1648 domain-containing protein [Eubacterium sp.]|nr:DUF1648 domain-containing protein [Eubacterium sp.]
MNTAKKHLILSTIFCALTLFIFLAFYQKLPESIPIHFDSSGSADSYCPRTAAVFGIPAASIVLNLLAAFSLTKKDSPSVFLYYAVPAASAVTALLVVYLALN